MGIDPGDTRPLVLVIDDDDAVRDAVVTALDAFGYRAIGAYDGSEALVLLQRERPAPGPPAQALKG